MEEKSVFLHDWKDIGVRSLSLLLLISAEQQKKTTRIMIEIFN
jgi:hypothetical protein